MSTIATAVFDADDDDNDLDFVPSHEDKDSEDENEAKGSASAVDKAGKSIDEDDTEDKDALWESFLASVSSKKSRPSTETPKLVKIVKTHRFAGEDVTEIVEVKEDSADARKWPRWQPPTQDVSQDTIPAANETESLNRGDGHISSSQTESATSPSSFPSTASTTPPKVESACAEGMKTKPRPGPRKPRTKLLSAPTPAPKKLSTLQKSALDWQAHVKGTGADLDSASASVTGLDSTSLADELEKNRRSGGYLERVAFLNRVEARRDELLEEGSSKRRRKG